MVRVLSTCALALLLAVVGPIAGQVGPAGPVEAGHDVLHAQLQEEPARPRARAPLRILQVNDLYSAGPTFSARSRCPE
jgi:hypothetical protein